MTSDWLQYYRRSSLICSVVFLACAIPLCRIFGAAGLVASKIANFTLRACSAGYFAGSFLENDAALKTTWKQQKILPSGGTLLATGLTAFIIGFYQLDFITQLLILISNALFMICWSESEWLAQLRAHLI